MEAKKRRKFKWLDEAEADVKQEQIPGIGETKKESNKSDFLNDIALHFTTEKPANENNAQKTEQAAPVTDNKTTPNSEQPGLPGQEKPKEQSGLFEQISSNIASLIPPEMIVNVVDTIFSRLFSLIAKFAGYKFKPGLLLMTSDEKKLLYPSVKAWLQTLQFNLTPLTAMLVSFGLVYTNKVMETTDIKVHKETVKKDRSENSKGRGRPAGVKNKNGYKKRNINVDLKS